MTPEQRNSWTANEMRARQARDEAWRQMWQGFQQYEAPQQEVTIIPNYQPAPSYNPYTEVEQYYGRKNREEQMRHPQIDSATDKLRELNRRNEAKMEALWGVHQYRGPLR
jgi:hypothetical protein